MPTFQSGVAVLPPVAVAVPIIVAAVLLVAGRRMPRPAVDATAIATGLGVVAITAIVLARAASGRVVTWSAGWLPKHGFSVGIVLVSDPVGAGAALLAACLIVCAFLYSWQYFESVEAHYHALMLMFLAGMVGFALTADLFDMFVFFELMGASAYALTGYKVEDESALQGALNFGIINSLGAYLSLMGVGLLYARTGNLGLPQLGQALAHHHADVLVVTAFVLVVTGFLVKSAMAPFHFWLADAHAVAPTPVCVLFSGIMVPLGTYAVLRVYWTVFGRILPPGEVRRMFIVMGLLTALVGALMCVVQRHVKRLLAYSTIAHVGLFLVALGCLTAEGTAGALIYVAGHAGVKSALFLCSGTLLNRYGSVDEHDLFRRGRNARVMPWLFAAGGIALAGLPPFGTALGKAVAEEAGSAAGYPWVPVLFVAVSALTGGAVLRVVARVYFGLGPRPRTERGDTTSGSQEEPEASLDRVPWTMVAAIGVLLVGALVMGLLPTMRAAADHAAAYFTAPAGYAAQALFHARSVVSVHRQPNWTGLGLGLGFLSALLAVGVAGVGLFGGQLRDRLGAFGRSGAVAMSGLRRLHSGHVGDYVAWLFTGMAALGGFIGLPLR